MLVSETRPMPETHQPESMSPLLDVRSFEGTFRAARVRAASKLGTD